MKKNRDTPLRTLSTCSLSIALLAFSSLVLAQGPATAEPSAAPITANTQTPTSLPADEAAEAQEEPEYAPLQVGDATQDLLAWQRNGDIASKTPRPIAGNVAQRSYERYLKSFEFPITERMSSTIKTSASNSGSAK